MIMENKKYQKHSIENKLEAYRLYKEEGYSTIKLAKKYNTSDTVIAKWIRKYEHGGIEELSRETRGKASKKGINKKRFSSIEEELNYVKAERDILKKTLEILNSSVKK